MKSLYRFTLVQWVIVFYLLLVEDTKNIVIFLLCLFFLISSVFGIVLFKQNHVLLTQQKESIFKYSKGECMKTWSIGYEKAYQRVRSDYPDVFLDYNLYIVDSLLMERVLKDLVD